MQKRSRIVNFLRKAHKEGFLFLFLIILIAFYLRTFNTNWDNAYYFHPDERAIVMFVLPIEMPKSFSEFLTPESTLNPHFFAYGNFPLYLLKIATNFASFFNPIFSEYGGMHFIGRPISALFDTLTIIFIFLIGRRYSKRAGLFASLLYAFSLYPIQLSHFFAVDTLLSFFMTGTLFFLLKLFEKPKILNSILVGIFIGLSLATKVSSLILILSILLIFILLSIKNRKQFAKNILLSISLVLSIFLSAFLVFVITQPYTIIDFSEFIKQTLLQSQMSKDAFIFPYTLQYVGKVPYFYELKNIFLWGLNPLLTVICLLGFVVIFISLFRKSRFLFINLLLVFYFLSYFLVFGKFAVGWMRYMLPIYPLLAIFGGFFISEIVITKLPKKFLQNHYLKKTILIFFIILLAIYPLSYLSIYTKPNTRIQASDWINKNISPESTIAIEHWDDGVPVNGMQNYNQLTFPLYDPDTPQKWELINQMLASTDYIILASNRLYKPLPKLIDCHALPPGRCYPNTASYYKSLFNGNLGFDKIAEFSEYPTIPFTNIKIVDDNADESFTVYDHPKVMIFKKRN